MTMPGVFHRDLPVIDDEFEDDVHFLDAPDDLIDEGTDCSDLGGHVWLTQNGSCSCIYCGKDAP